MARRLTFEFLHTEAASAGVLAFGALGGLVIANSPAAAEYHHVLKSLQPLRLGPLGLEMTVSDWVKQGLMSLFFLVVGLEIKHEILRGELSDPRKLAMPVGAAVGGMAGPILIYLAAAALVGAPLAGWPVPVATDIAFALGVFALVGRALPPSLRTFLLTLAIVDDLGAIALIGVLFSDGVQWALVAIVVSILVALWLCARHLRLPSPMWILGFVLVWSLSLEARLSTSLAAVAFAGVVPLKPRREDHQSPLQEAMADLHPWNAFLVLPVFAFAKAGVSLAGVASGGGLAPLSIAIASGLVLGKPLGVMSAGCLLSRLGWGVLPQGASWRQIWGVSLLCGIGFTMSLFIGALTFGHDADGVQAEVQLGVLTGSAMSAVLAVALLALRPKTRLGD